jgi:hypothetical protein
MCMEDIKLGRELSPAATVVAVATGAARSLVPADPNRTRLVLSSDGTGTLFVAPEGITPAALTGFVLNPSLPQMTIRVEEWGKLVVGAWQAFAAAGTINVATMQATLERQR